MENTKLKSTKKNYYVSKSLSVEEGLRYYKNLIPQDEWEYNSELKIFVSSTGRIGSRSKKRGLLNKSYNDIRPAHFKSIEEGLSYYTELHPGEWRYSPKHNCFACKDGTLGSACSRFTGPDGNGLLKKSVMNNGYISCNSSTAHRAVWEAFNGDIPEDKEINHINKNRQDNRLENLELVTHKENIITRNNAWTGRNGYSHAASIPVLQYDTKGNLIREFGSQNQAAKELGIHQASISYCCIGKLHTAGGFVFKYKYSKDEVRREIRNKKKY